MYEIPETFKRLLALHAKQKRLGKKQFDIELCDPRGAFCRELTAFVQSVSKALVEGIPGTQLEEYYLHSKPVPVSEDSEIQWVSNSSLYKFAGLSRSITVEQFLVYMKDTEEKIFELGQRSTHEGFKKVVLKYGAVYQAARRDCIALLSGQDHKRSLWFGLMSLFDRSKDINERFRRYDKIHKAFVECADYVHAEMFLLERLLERLSLQPAVALYSGRSHSERLAHILVEELGCKILSSADGVHFAWPLCYSITPTIINELLPNGIIDFFLEPLASSKRFCWSCKLQKEQLKHCTQCKKALYCDQRCQRNHWNAHKSFCSAHHALAITD